MFVQSAIFVVGAGASAEFGMPTGVQLIDRVADRASLRQLAKGTRHFAQENISEGDADRLADVVRSFVSIDEALHYYSDRKEVVALGKLAIAEQILSAERKSKLFTEDAPFVADLRRARETWLADFLSMAAGSHTMSQMETVFRQVTLVNFNYDRCVEHYLLSALQGHFHLGSDTAKASLQRLTVVRPYGSLGKSVGFGEVVDAPRLVEVAKGIRTFTEQSHDQAVLSDLRQRIARASLVVFLGFGFHEQNVALLSAADACSVRVFGTVSGIPHYNHDALKARIKRGLRTEYQPLLYDLRAHELLAQLRPSLLMASA